MTLVKRLAVILILFSVLFSVGFAQANSGGSGPPIASSGGAFIPGLLIFSGTLFRKLNSKQNF